MMKVVHGWKKCCCEEFAKIVLFSGYVWMALHSEVYLYFAANSGC